MSRPAKPPAYLRCADKRARKVYAQCRITWPGGRTETRKLGIYGSPESYQALAAVIAQWQEAHDRGVDPKDAPQVAGVRAVTVADLCREFIERELAHRIDSEGKPKQEVHHYRVVLSSLVRKFGELRVEEFGPKKVKDLREAWVTGSWRTPEERKALERKGKNPCWSRSFANRQLNRLKTFFSWLASEELLPPGKIEGLLEVRGLERDQLSARDTPEVLPAPEQAVEETLGQIDHPVASDLVRLQLLTAARPGELVRLRPCELSRTGSIQFGKGLSVDVPGCWTYQPAAHKTAHKGVRRIVLFGPRAQALLEPYLDRVDRDTDYLFRPNRSSSAHYSSGCYRQCVQRAAARASRPGLEGEIAALIGRSVEVVTRRGKRSSEATYLLILADGWRPYRRQVHARSRCRVCGVLRSYTPWTRTLEVLNEDKSVRTLVLDPAAEIRLGTVCPWTVYQLRHNAASRLVEQFGWDVARIVLGHTTVDTTREYAVDDIRKAAEAIHEVG